MLLAFQFLVAMLVALAAALSTAHALEMPGKMRLDRESYFIVQKIYYPGFTVGGIGEGLAVIATLALLIVTPAGSSAFWFSFVAFLAAASMQIVYWLRVHPVNRVWLKDQKLSRSAEKFFDSGAAVEAGREWKALRNRWEYSHLARAVLGAIALAALVAAIGVS
jgi:hypothetical protein